MPSARKFEQSSMIGWAKNGICLCCGQKTTASPKECKDREHKAYYLKRKLRIQANRMGAS